MPGPYGVTSTGFNPMTLQDIKAELEDAWRGVFGAGIDVSSDSVDGQIIGIMADRLATVWQNLQAAYNAAFPDSATGVALDGVLSITGAVRQPQTKSRVDIVLTGVPGTNIPQFTRFSVAGAGTLFELSDTSPNIGGSGNVFSTATAVEYGPQKAPAGTLTVIETPVAGLTSVTNGADQHVLGTTTEKDPAARLRRELSIRAIGSASLDAIRAALLNITNVTSARVFENTTDGTVDGMPPHSFEAVVVGGDDTTIGQAIFDRKPAGTPSHGNTTTVATDSLLGTHNVKWSRPVALDAYVTINVQVTEDAPEDVDDLIKDAVVDWGDLNLHPGGSLVSQQLIKTIFDQPGVWDCPPPFIGTAPAPGTSTTVTATPRQIIDLDTSRVVVNVTRI